MSGGRGERLTAGGSVLILALWVVFFLAALTLATGAHVAAILGAAERLTARTRAQAQASGAAAYAAAVIMSQKTNAWDGLPDSAWNCDERVFRDAEVGGMRCSLTFETPDAGRMTRRYGVIGEEGRINLNIAAPPLLTAFFMTAGGMDRSEAESLSAAVRAWRGERDEMLTGEGSKGYYAQVMSSSRAGRPFSHPEELLLVEGVSVELFRKLRPLLTIYGTGLVNINAAPAAVLEALGAAYSGGREGSAVAAASLAAKIVRCRAAGNAFERAEYLAMRTALERFEPLNSDEGAVFAGMAGRLAVRSTAFGGMAQGGTDTEDDTPAVRVDFVWDAQARRFVMWRER